ncbi:MAG: hypothetical protein RIQ88_521 [Actinomycetota bacterium]
MLAESSGGFTPEEWAFQRTPSVVVYSDGLTIAQLPIRTQVYPGPVVSSFLQKTELAAVARVLAGVQRTNLDDPEFDWGQPMITDMNSTTVVSQVSRAAKRTTVSIYALTSVADHNLPQPIRTARNAASAFIDQVASFNSNFYRTKSKPITWKPTRWIYLARPASQVTKSNTRVWFGSTLNREFGCREMTSVENKKFTELVPKLNENSRWISQGTVWKITVRPLLPHETSCSDRIY